MKQEGSREEKKPQYRIMFLRCRRTNQWVAPAEHKGCRYCFGTESEVECGLYTTFCDYRPGVDAPGAEFPIDLERYSSG